MKVFRLSDLLLICLHAINEEHTRLTIFDLLDHFANTSAIENRLEPDLLHPTRMQSSNDLNDLRLTSKFTTPATRRQEHYGKILLNSDPV